MCAEWYRYTYLLARGGEGRDAKLCVDRRREVPVTVIWENRTNVREKFILAMWFIEQKVIIFRCRTDVRDEPVRPEPARPGPTRPGHDAF